MEITKKALGFNKLRRAVRAVENLFFSANLVFLAFLFLLEERKKSNPAWDCSFPENRIYSPAPRTYCVGVRPTTFRKERVNTE